MFLVKKLQAAHSFCSNTYLVSSMDECAVVDPSSPYRTAYGRVKYVLLTHAHFDHMLDIDSWVNEGGATVIVSRYDKMALPDSFRNCSSVFSRDFAYNGRATAIDDGDTLTLGDEIIEIISVPGHTPGSVMYKINDTAFVGDLIFAGGGFGRTDLPGGDEQSLHCSIQKLLCYAGSTVLLTGHGEATTVEEYKRQYRNF